MYTLGLTCVLVYKNTNKCNSQVTHQKQLTTIRANPFVFLLFICSPYAKYNNNGGNEDEAFRGGFGCNDSFLCGSAIGCSG